MDEIQTWLKVTCDNVEQAIVTARFGMLRYLIFYNIIMWSLYFNFNYVHQKDYSRFDVSRVESRLDALLNTRVCVDKQYEQMFTEGFVINQKPCTQIDVIIEQGETKVEVQEQKVVVRTSQMDSRAYKMLKGAMDYYGHAPFGLNGYSPNLLTFNSLSHVHVTIFYDKAPTFGLAQKIES